MSNEQGANNYQEENRCAPFFPKKFELFEPPLKPKNPISPKKKQNVAIAAVIGLMLGVLIAFFREFWANGAGEESRR